MCTGWEACYENHLSRSHDGREEEGGASFRALGSLCEGCLEGGLWGGEGGGVEEGREQ